jgi:predicted CDP-diglyceride synthetase/phosphatidate cytidylyltransferase
MQRWTRRRDIVPDIVALIIWVIAGVAGGNGAGELLKGSYDLGPANTISGAIGGIVGAMILQVLIPSLRGFDVGPILGQVIVAAVSGGILTIVAGAVKTRRQRRQ